MREYEFGKQFDVPEFHRIVLDSGAMPLDMREEQAGAGLESAP